MAAVSCSVIPDRPRSTGRRCRRPRRPTAPGVIESATRPDERHRRQHADGGRTSGPTPTHQRATSRTTNQASLATTAAANPSTPCCVSMAFERSRRSSMPRRCPSAASPDQPQMRWATGSSQPPAPREALRAHDGDPAGPPRDEHHEADQASRSTRGPDGLTGDEHAGRGDQRQGKMENVSNMAARRSRRSRHRWIDHWRYSTNRVAMSVGPGTVLTTAGRPGPIRPRAARRARHEDSGRARAGDPGDALMTPRSASCPAVSARARRERRRSRPVAAARPEHDREDTDEHQRATRDRPTPRRRLSRRPDRRARDRPFWCCVRHHARTHEARHQSIAVLGWSQALFPSILSRISEDVFVEIAGKPADLTCQLGVQLQFLHLLDEVVIGLRLLEVA